MILYHGSNTEIAEVSLLKSRPNKDFGRAFYLSPTEEQAREMAEFRAELEGGSPVINRYSFDEKWLNTSELKTLHFGEYSEEWARFVFANRDAAPQAAPHGYDIVYGPIANDRVGRQISNFKDGFISFETFIERLKFMKGITFQYAFCTEAAISKLKKI